MRRRGLRALILGVVTATLAAGLPAGPAQAAPRATAGTTATVRAPSDHTARQSTSVTLITGDRVTVHGDDRLGVEAAPGRAGMRFISQTVKNHRYVIPHDALPLLQSDHVDRRLFDVTALIEFGYDDRAAELPLLVSYPEDRRQDAAAARAAATVDGARVVRDLPVVGALAVRADRAARSTLWGSLTAGDDARSLRAGVDKIWLDGRRSLSLDVSVPQIGAPAAWQAGFDGTGVKVAVLDTGIDATHPDLIGQIAAAENFTEDPDTDDFVGHGTHVASTIAGTGAASNGRYKGVAPGAKLLNGKVCVDYGCDESWILAGMEWAAQQGAQVISMSLGGSDSPSIDPLEQAVNDLTAQFGSLFVIAAGNDGAAASVGSPSSADAALSVGAVDRDDELAEFSSRGPRRGDDAIKPEITAPGVDIVAAKAAHDQIGGPAPVGGYASLSGTSMATPHVAGAAAILTQQHPDWSWSQRKNTLTGSAQPNPDLGVFSQGAGRVDVAREITQTVVSEPGTVSFGRQLWPHGDDTPITRTVTYRNTGTAPVTLALTASSDAPAGTFTLAASTLAVPAGGTAATTLTANTAVTGPDGHQSGYLVATATGGVQVTTPFAVNKEVESYDVTFVHTDRDGTAATDFFTNLFDLETFESIDIFAEAEGGPAVVRVPKGTYGLFSWIYDGWQDEDDTNNSTTMLVQPELTVDAGTRTVRLDARKAKGVSVTVPAADATPALVGVNAEWASDDWTYGATALADTFDGLYSGQLGRQSAVEGFTASVNTTFAKLTGESFRNSPFTYDLVWFRKGSFYTGFVKTVRPRDLATVRATYAAQAAGAEGVKANFGALPGGGGGWAVGLPFDLPFRRTEYVNADSGALWTSYFDEQLPPVGEDWPVAVAGAQQLDHSYRPGRTYTEKWNNAVFGPSVANAPAAWPDAWASRTGDVVIAGVPLYADGSGRTGYSVVDTARTALYRNGTLVGETEESYGEFEVPAERAAYRLDMAAQRSAPSTLSTRVEASWTFSSGHVAGEEYVDFDRLPLSTVRFTPSLDERNTAPAGRGFTVPVTVDRLAGSDAGRTRSLTVEVSYDDGLTWKKAPLLGRGDHRTALVRHPAGDGFVSLRARATDTAGNTVTQTVIRAYRIG